MMRGMIIVFITYFLFLQPYVTLSLIQQIHSTNRRAHTNSNFNIIISTKYRYNIRHNNLLRVSVSKSTSISSIFKNNNISLIVGLLGLLIILMNRIIIGEVSDIQSRADLLSVFACSGLLLNVLSEQEVTEKEREKVALVGYSLNQPIFDENNEKTISKSSTLWLINSLLKSNPVTSIHVLYNDRFVAMGGIIASNKANNFSPISISEKKILKESIANDEEVYLPDLQILPAKVEFLSYLPINSQSVLIIPIKIVLGSEISSLPSDLRLSIIIATNQVKGLKLKDLTKIRSLVK
eukprot:gene4717-6621_t